MNTITQAFDSRSMPLTEPSTAPSAFSLWRWLSERATAKVLAQQQANTQRDHAQQLAALDPGLANDPRAQADLREDRHGR